MSFDIMAYAGEALSGYSFFIASGSAWNTGTHLFDITPLSAALTTPGTWISIDTSAAGINLSAGQPFVVGWTSSGGSGRLAASGNTYAGGGFWPNARDVGQLHTKLDLAFQTHMEDGIAAVPEPYTYMAGALLLLPFGVSTIRNLCKRLVA